MDENSLPQSFTGSKEANRGTIRGWQSGQPALLRGTEVFKRVALSRTTIWRRIQQGTFPAPVSLGPTRIAWREADIVAWIEAQKPVGDGHGTPGSRPA